MRISVDRLHLPSETGCSTIMIMKLKPGRDGVALYHAVLADEDFERTVFNLLQLLQKAQREYPGQKKSLYIDIEGHRNAAGGFDRDMLELQSKFATDFLIQFLSRIVMPMATLENPHPQKDEVPGALTLISKDEGSNQEPPDEGSEGPKPNPRF